MRLLRSGPISRRGVAMLTAVALLGVVMLIAAGLLQQIASERRASNLELQKLQAGYLAESGLNRAVMKLKQDEEYAGEDWRPVVKLAGMEHTAEVAITVKPNAEARTTTVMIKAKYPANSGFHAAQATLQRTIPLQKSN